MRHLIDRRFDVEDARAGKEPPMKTRPRFPWIAAVDVGARLPFELRPFGHGRVLRRVGMAVRPAARHDRFVGPQLGPHRPEERLRVGASETVCRTMTVPADWFTLRVTAPRCGEVRRSWYFGSHFQMSSGWPWRYRPWGRASATSREMPRFAKCFS